MRKIDSQLVSKALNGTIRPALRAEGFDRFTGKNAWRGHDHGIDNIGFRAMNDYTATTRGCTTLSLTGEAGVLYSEVPPGPTDRPHDVHMTIRGTLTKTIRQPIFHPFGRPDGSDLPHVWYIQPDGSNLDEVVADIARAVREKALPYLTRLGTPPEALSALRTEVSTTFERTYGTLGTWMPGNPGSPGWLSAHALLATLSNKSTLDPSTAPVLTPAQRWFTQYQQDEAVLTVDDIIDSLAMAGLIAVLHQIPLPLIRADRVDEGPLAIHVYVNPDGTLNRASVL